jgi:hypothetical protein
MAEAMLGAPAASWSNRLPGEVMTSNVRFAETSMPGRNVVAILPGTDAKLKGQYVAIGAHSDHIPPRQQPVDHDSLRAYMQVVRPQGADSRRPPTPEKCSASRQSSTACGPSARHGWTRSTMALMTTARFDDGAGNRRTIRQRAAEAETVDPLCLAYR